MLVILFLIALIALALWAGEGFPALHIPKRKRDDPFAGARSLAASRAEYVRIEREAMAAWEDACRCPEPRRFRNLDGTLGDVMPLDAGSWDHMYRIMAGKRGALRPDTVVSPSGHAYAPMNPPMPGGGYQRVCMNPPMAQAYYVRRNLPMPGSELSQWMGDHYEYMP